MATKKNDNKIEHRFLVQIPVISFDHHWVVAESEDQAILSVEKARKKEGQSCDGARVIDDYWWNGEVFEFFHSWPKMKAWFESPNPQLGNITPVEMILRGRSKKLLKFIEDAIEGNKHERPLR